MLTPADHPSHPTLTDQFNAASSHAVELESKHLVNGNDTRAFTQIRDYFVEKGWVHVSQPPKRLLTRQFDTPEKELLSVGDTLRTRSGCSDQAARAHNFVSTDICIKADKTLEASGAIKRAEFEAPHPDQFTTLCVDTLREKYPVENHPRLHEILDSVRAEDLVEHFRIDCIRERYLIELPESETGVVGKRVVAEMVLDRVSFVVDLPRYENPYVYDQDQEVECELMFKPCSYDSNPDSGKYVSSSMTLDEANRGMEAFTRHLHLAAPGMLTANKYSKAERGFFSQAKVMPELQAMGFALPCKQPPPPSVRPASLAR
jgi:hypothetical protein